MNQAIRIEKAIRQDSGERTLDRVRKEMDMSPVARSAREGMKLSLSKLDRSDKQTSGRIEDEKESKTITSNGKLADRRHARWLFHYEQEKDKPAQRQHPNSGPKRTKKRRGE
jgi:hypothetical protein